MSAVSFVLLNHNSGLYVEKLIDSLADQQNADWDLVVVDNASENDSLGWIIRRLEYNRLKNCRVIRLHKNLHFTGGMNTGIRETSGEIVVPLNSDVYLAPDFVEILVRSYRSIGKRLIGAFAGNEFVWDWNGRGLTEDLRSSGVSLVKRMGVSSWKPGRESAVKLLGPSGSAPALVRKSLEEITLPDRNYYDNRFLSFGEDIDLYMRLRLKGFKTLYLPDLNFWHIGSATYSGKDISLTAKKPDLIARILTNKWRIWRKIPSLRERLVLFPPVMSFHIINFFAVLFRKGIFDCLFALRSYLKILSDFHHEDYRTYTSSPTKKGLFAGWFFSKSHWAGLFIRKNHRKAARTRQDGRISR